MAAVGVVMLFAATCFLAYANGANDNFKGVATLFGSRTTSYRRALWWATATTLAGSLCSLALAGGLVARFSGKGLVPDEIATSGDFALALAFGAGLTVMLATLIGFPVSTTHGLTGALVGGGLLAAGSALNLQALGRSFVLPLLVSPVAALAAATIVYVVFRWLRERMGVEHVPTADEPQAARATPEAESAAQPELVSQYEGSVLGLRTQSVLDTAHYASAGVVSFARGLNDTPKIVALLLVAHGLKIDFAMLAVAAAIAVGGLLNARRVAETMSCKITPMTHGQGFSANLVTGALVVLASRWALPVSTTHVSCGSLFGIGLVNRKANLRVISEIVLSWVLTLPVAAAASALAYALLTAR